MRAADSARNLHFNYQDDQISDKDQRVVDARRQGLVERVAREVYENLLFSGSTNPIVEEIKAQLEVDLGFAVLLEILFQIFLFKFIKKLISGR